MKRDPVIRLRQWLESRDLWSEEQEAQARADAEKEIAMVVKNAEEIDAPAASDFFDNMFVEMTPELKKQRQTMRTSSIGQDPSQIDVKQSEGAIK